MFYEEERVDSWSWRASLQARMIGKDKEINFKTLFLLFWIFSPLSMRSLSSSFPLPFLFLSSAFPPLSSQSPPSSSSILLSPLSPLSPPPFLLFPLSAPPSVLLYPFLPSQVFSSQFSSSPFLNNFPSLAESWESLCWENQEEEERKRGSQGEREEKRGEERREEEEVSLKLLWLFLVQAEEKRLPIFFPPSLSVPPSSVSSSSFSSSFFLSFNFIFLSFSFLVF